jgi:hypothetical protein
VCIVIYCSYRYGLFGIIVIYCFIMISSRPRRTYERVCVRVCRGADLPPALLRNVKDPHLIRVCMKFCVYDSFKMCVCV